MSNTCCGYFRYYLTPVLCLFPLLLKAAALDPAPYRAVTAEAHWRDRSGRELCFCALGDPGAGRALAVYEKKDGAWERLFLDDDRGFHPWKIVVAELDGDPLPEVAVGTYKKTRYDPVLDKRLFIFDWTEDDTLFAKWLGSRLGWRFDDFGFERGAAGPGGYRIDKLLSVEHSGRERLVLRRYQWNGFGWSHEVDLVRVRNPPDYEAARERLIRKMHGLADEGGGR